ncbi:MAG: SDR family oxidoreductase [Bryobacterales bacterium]|nr:SDR family oxidoreductase [Bryobacterales bacterium]
MNVALITGAGSGMGMETALHLASRGYRVYGSVCTEAERTALESAARLRKVELDIVTFDVTREDQVRPAVDSILATTGRIDVLVQFVGIGLRGFFEDLDISEIERVFQVNLFGLMRVTQAVLPYMRKAGRGRIILTSSVGGRMASMGIGGYASSKFAIEGWGESLHQEMAAFNIRVSLLEPGLIRTPHFGIHRNVSRRAADPASPYYAWFRRHESLVDGLLAKSSFTTADVARKVEQILSARRPRLRYVVGTKAKWVLALRRYIPGELFESVYWSAVRRAVTRPEPPDGAGSQAISEKAL